MKIYFIVLFSVFIFSCKSTDIDKIIKDIDVGRMETNAGQNIEFPEYVFPPEIIVIERPVFVPALESPGARNTGTALVQESNRAGIINPSDYSHAAIIYDYNINQVYEVYTQPNRITDITLQPNETVTEPPFVSDSDNWILGGGVNYENGSPVQHIYVNPLKSGISTTLIINTDRRVYRLILKSFSHTHMPLVKWRYLPPLPNNFIQQAKQDSDSSFPGVDPRFLSFNYRITRSIFNKPYWLPQLVFDDGSKTYITFPNVVLQRELPTVFENRNNILNYRVVGNVIIIDKLIESIVIKIGRSEVIIKKKRG